MILNFNDIMKIKKIVFDSNPNELKRNHDTD